MRNVVLGGIILAAANGPNVQYVTVQ